MLLNRVAGILLYLIIYSPLLLIQTLLVALLFVDKLIEGKYRAAAAELLYSPIKILTMLVQSLLHIVVSGWGVGFTGFFDLSFARIKTYWTDFYNTDARYFSALFFQKDIALYEGPYVGALAHKLSLLFYASYYFGLYKNYHLSPHSPIVTLTANELYDLVDQHYGKKAKDRLKIIPREIESFLTELQTTIIDPEDMTVLYAQNCLQQIQTGFLNQAPAHDLKTSSKHYQPKTPFNTLCLVWTVIHEYRLSSYQTLQLKKLTANYLANLQRNLSASSTALDLEECSTGMINSFLEVLKAVDPQKFTLQLSKTDSWTTVKTLLQERMDQQYYTQKNAQDFVNQVVQKHISVSLPPTTSPRQTITSHEKEKEKFISEHGAALKYYGRFLISTPQGKAITGLGALDENGVDAVTDEVLGSWDYPEKRSGTSMRLQS